MLYTSFPTPVGTAFAVLKPTAQGDALVRLGLYDRPEDAERAARRLREAEPAPDAPLFAELRRQLAGYVAGTCRRFDLPLALEGTEFQLRVWDALLQIPWGETRSYGDIARAVGDPGGARAVGAANHENPIIVVVPCHRVIGADGSLVGYGGGLPRKRRLLEIEGVLTPGLF